MSGVLILGEEEIARIKAAIKRAQANAVPLEAISSQIDGSFTNTLLLKDRKPNAAAFRKKYHPENVFLGTYRAAISFEHQPAGLMRHISVSTTARGKVPGPYVMQMVCEAFGFSEMLCSLLVQQNSVQVDTVQARVWAEEFEPGQMAINVVELVVQS